MNELRQQKNNIVLIIGKIIELDFRIFVFNTKFQILLSFTHSIFILAI